MKHTWRSTLVDRWTSPKGHSRRFDSRPITSGLPQSTDIIRLARLVRFVPMGDIRVHKHLMQMRAPKDENYPHVIAALQGADPPIWAA